MRTGLIRKEFGYVKAQCKGRSRLGHGCKIDRDPRFTLGLEADAGVMPRVLLFAVSAASTMLT